MLKTNAPLVKQSLKNSTQIDPNNRSFRECRESEVSDRHDGSKSALKRINTASRVLPANELSASTRLSRRSSNQPRPSDRPNDRNNLEKMVTQLKEEYAQEARLSRYSNLVKAKSEHNFTPSCRPKPAAEVKEKSSIEELQ